MNREQETQFQIMNTIDALVCSVFEEGAIRAEAVVDFGYIDGSDDEYELTLVFQKKDLK